MNEKALDLHLHQLKVAFDVLLTAHEQARQTGRIQNPGLTAAALAEVDSMILGLSSCGLGSVPFDGSDVNELLRRGRELLKNSTLNEV